MSLQGLLGPWQSPGRKDFFAEVLPEFDRERVHAADIKKLISWYNILIENGVTDFDAVLEPTDGDNIDDRKAE